MKYQPHLANNRMYVWSARAINEMQTVNSDMSGLWIPDPWQYFKSHRQYFAGNPDPQKNTLKKSGSPVDPQKFQIIK